jgi:N6-adenosine-specific RNA methylase IME4
VRYRTIVADPPWRYTITPPLKAGKTVGLSAEDHYSTMGQDEIAALPIATLAEDDAHLYMWVTNPVLTEQRLKGGPNVCAIARGWGFEPKTLLELKAGKVSKWSVARQVRFLLDTVYMFTRISDMTTKPTGLTMTEDK